MRIGKILAFIAIAVAAVCPARIFCAETAAMSPLTPKISAELEKSKYLSARDALESGLPSLAESISESTLKAGVGDDRLRGEFTRVLLDALIAQGKYELAQKYLGLENLSEASTESKIRGILINVGLNRPDEASRLSDSINPKDISAEDMAWYHLGRGYIYYARNDIQNALKQFEMAKSASLSGFAAADAEIAMNICKLSEDIDIANVPSIRADLDSKVRFYMGTAIGFQFAKQYAALLFKIGEIDRALEVINEQLSIEISQEIDKDELRLMEAAMIKDPSKRRTVLENILRSTKSSDIAEAAVSLLATKTSASSQDLEKFLSELVQTAAPTVGDALLIELSKAALKNGKIHDAAKYASRIMEEYPASRYRYEALRILSWTSFYSDAKKAPEYRLAATYLAELALLEKNIERSLKIKMLAADCYFLNKDYANAAKIYEELFEAMSEDRGTILNRAAEARIAMNDEEGAVKLIERAYRSKNVNDDDLWEAVSQLISKYRREGRLDSALVRLEKAVSKDPSASEVFRIRVMWLRACSIDESKDAEKTAKICGKISAAISSLSDAAKKSVSDIGANAMLMHARALDSLGKFEGESGSIKIFENLRSLYPQSEAAQLSYLYEARACAAAGRLDAARQYCDELVSKYPESRYAYDAIFDSAQYARQLGTDANYRDALTMLDKLCKKYPDNPRNFYARLSQAEILRLLNAFADARSLYNDITGNFQSHPEVHLAWLGLGDSTLAQPNREADAAAIFERLYSLPDMPQEARAEAAYKWAFALERAGKSREADEVRWVTASELLRGKKQNLASRYWTGRSLFELARSLEHSSDARDARSVYELIVRHNLPSADAAALKLKK